MKSHSPLEKFCVLRNSKNKLPLSGSTNKIKEDKEGILFQTDDVLLNGNILILVGDGYDPLIVDLG